MIITDTYRLNWIEEKSADVTYNARLCVWEVNSEYGITYSNNIRVAIDQQINKVETLVQ